MTPIFTFFHHCAPEHESVLDSGFSQADPTGELQAALCRKIEGNSVLFKDSETDQPRDLCNSWVAAQNLSVGISYADVSTLAYFHFDTVISDGSQVSVTNHG